ncbi:CehA/McbA family metallohydrolase [Luteitalea pratensis]|uniref:CehA/McbA family metallohydrolase n=1 Tax=Luteitalea pratensis TaxID=1855912 RepID=UPI001F3F0CF9|nr:CehA/McbA family metallohydrolase [Luteitalea pratensis]
MSRRVFLHSTSIVPAALAVPALMRPPTDVTTACAGLAMGTVESCESRLPLVAGVPLQPFVSQVTRMIGATEYLGAPLPPEHQHELEAALKMTDEASAVASIQRVLDCHCLVGVQINPEMRVKVAPGPARPELVEQGWRHFLVKVHNEAGTTAVLRGISSQARRLAGAMPDEVRNLWLDLQMFESQPLTRTLSGLALEYRIVQLYSRDPGQREATLTFDVGQGTQDLGYRNEVPVLFTIRPAETVEWRVRDETGAPTVAAFVIRDAQGRVYPSRAKRLAPDFAFHPQVYRADGELVRLPAGRYDVEFWRGPESMTKTQQLTVAESAGSASGQSGGGGAAQGASFQIERWIDPAKFGWWSGDHHIHAAGCAHYMNPTEGVLPADMVRHTLGEDLKVGATLTWGPAFDTQKRFFTGRDDLVSRPPYLLHYDVEVSGFGSHQSGHLVLLRLKEQIHPGGTSYEHWPTLGLNTLRWAKRQGAVCGPAHSGWGLEVNSSDLPNYVVPPFNGIGANEYIVDVTHEVPGPDGKPVRAVDFISTVDTPYVWELNIWYHTLNVGFRTRISGETDFPCIYGEKVGLGRSYVKLDGKLDYADWCEGLHRGRNYVGDGRSHLLDFTVDTVRMGESESELRLSDAGPVKVHVRAAALLNEKPSPERGKRRYQEQPYWDVERARIGETREVAVELVVNGYPVAKQSLVADGALRDLTFDATIERSSWLAVRILPSSHTNPIWVPVAGKPVRASRRSAEWCLKGVDQCWSQKERFIKRDELDQAKADYEHARRTYQRLISESEVE